MVSIKNRPKWKPVTYATGFSFKTFEIILIETLLLGHKQSWEPQSLFFGCMMQKLVAGRYIKQCRQTFVLWHFSPFFCTKSNRSLLFLQRADKLFLLECLLSTWQVWTSDISTVWKVFCSPFIFTTILPLLYTTFHKRTTHLCNPHICCCLWRYMTVPQ